MKAATAKTRARVTIRRAARLFVFLNLGIVPAGYVPTRRVTIDGTSRLDKPKLSDFTRQ